MLEMPEALTIAGQINNTIKKRKIINVVTEHTPHKFAWYHGDPQRYGDILVGKTIDKALAYGGIIEINVDTTKIIVSDGVALRYHKQGEKLPVKHQLLLELDDSSVVSASVQMYGGIWCFDNEAEFKNSYCNISKEKPSPLSDEFSEIYFNKLISSEDSQKLSIKALLATEQRIPGLGNGVLQDILWKARIHPKSKVNTLSKEKKGILYSKIKEVLYDMLKFGGRDTEKDFFGNKGGYKTMMSKNNLGKSCTKCGGIIKKESYLGGSIYYCDTCQLL